MDRERKEQVSQAKTVRRVNASQAEVVKDCSGKILKNDEEIRVRWKE